MILVCHTWSVLLKFEDENLAASAYADNWSFWGELSSHPKAIESTLAICDFLGLQVDLEY